MAAQRFNFDPSRIRISDEEILADLNYPAGRVLPRHHRTGIRPLGSGPRRARRR